MLTLIYVLLPFAGCLLYNIDGVRCWLPCIDRIEQRTFFKLTITSPSDVDVITSGKITLL